MSYDDDPRAEAFAKENVWKTCTFGSNKYRGRIVGYDSQTVWLEWLEGESDQTNPVVAANLDYWFDKAEDPFNNMPKDGSITLLVRRDQVSRSLTRSDLQNVFLDTSPEWPQRCLCGQPGVLLFISFKCCTSFCKVSRPANTR